MGEPRAIEEETMSKTCKDCRHYEPPKAKGFKLYCSEPGKNIHCGNLTPCSGGPYPKENDMNTKELVEKLKKPEYEDIEIVSELGWIRLKKPAPGKEVQGLGKAIQHPQFVGFISDSGWVGIEEIATRIHEGQKVIARFRREQ